MKTVYSYHCKSDNVEYFYFKSLNAAKINIKNAAESIGCDVADLGLRIEMINDEEYAGLDFFEDALGHKHEKRSE